MTDPWWTDGAVTIWHGDALALPLDDGTVDLVVTSPPYFGLRSYTDAGEHYAGQIGSEATPAEFLDALVAATAEMVRVLKPGGSIWVNLGDKYSGAQGQTQTGVNGRRHMTNTAATWRQTDPKRTGIPNKSLMGLPWRYALRCVDDLGLILRAEVIWSKPNGLPESVTDRVRRSHEQWFHFTREPRYFAAVDEIRETHSEHTLRYYGPGTDAKRRPVNKKGAAGAAHSDPSQYRHQLTTVGALGKLPGSVWEVPTQPLTVPDELGVDHFAAFPVSWPLRIIRGWSPTGWCTACGEPRRPVVDKQAVRTAGRRPETQERERLGTALGQSGFIADVTWQGYNRVSLTGYACACPTPDAPTRPAVVLDPFGGTGTTALAARALGRRAHHVDLSADYCRLARWRVTDPGELARALELPKPPPAPADTDALFDLEVGG